MYFSYRPLEVLLAEHGMSKTEFRNAIHISTVALAKIAKNEAVSMDVLARACQYFQCRIEDIIEFVPDITNPDTDAPDP